MAVHVRYVTDPACSWSWGFEPTLRRLVWEFGSNLSFTYVMGGLARSYPDDRGARSKVAMHWVEAAGSSGMPLDPGVWGEDPITSTFPVCMAVRAASEQGDDAGARYLRAVRQGIMCSRRRLDAPEALVEEARRVGLDVERFRADLGSSATVESFGRDLEEARRVPDEARRQGGTAGKGEDERLTFPSLVVRGDDGVERGLYGSHGYDECREALVAAGAVPSGGERPGVMAALQRFGSMATAELEAVCGTPGPPLRAELWRAAAEWRLKPTRVLTGWLWELA